VTAANATKPAQARKATAEQFMEAVRQLAAAPARLEAGRRYQTARSRWP
jgi:hypothetical protein